MTTVPTHPDSALTLLFGPGDRNPELMDTILTASNGGDLDRALKKLPPPTRDVAAREVTTATAELLDINLVDVLLRGWREYADLTSAARRTLAAPDTSELVSLTSHRVRMSQQPSVAVLVDGRQVADLRLGLSLVFEVKAVLARVRAGQLVAVVSGNCDVTATLAIDDVDIVSKQAQFELPGEAALTKPLRLLPARDYPPGDDGAKMADAAAAVSPDGTVHTHTLNNNAEGHERQKQAVQINALAATASPVAPKADNEQAGRLRKLQELQEAGLLNQGEYEDKRAEIISSI